MLQMVDLFPIQNSSSVEKLQIAHADTIDAVERCLPVLLQLHSHFEAEALIAQIQRHFDSPISK